MNSKISFVCKVFGIVFAGLLGVYFMCSGHNHEQAILQNAKVCFEEALQEEKKNSTAQVHISYDASKATYTLEDALDWLAQSTSIKMDSCRRGLDSIYHAKLTQAGYPVQTAISYTRNGRTTVSKPNLDLSHMYPVGNKVYSMKHDTIRLQAYVPIAFVHTQKYKFSIGLGLVVGSILLGFGIWWMARKKRNTDKAASFSQRVLIDKNCYWESRSGIFCCAGESVILTGMQEKFFDQLVKSPDYVAMYQDFLVFYPEQELTKATIDKIQHSMQTLKKNLKAFPVVIEPIRGKGYQLCFKVEEMVE